MPNGKYHKEAVRRDLKGKKTQTEQTTKEPQLANDIKREIGKKWQMQKRQKLKQNRCKRNDRKRKKEREKKIENKIK